MHPALLRLLALSLVLAAGQTMGAEPPAKKRVPPPPPLPAADTDEPDVVEPEVTITTRGETTYEEYRVNGRLYKVKVNPKYGSPYYLLFDENGTQRRSDLEPDVIVPNWVIKRF
jgi:hypothetical protein